jgi:hypothetical protein
LSGIEHVEPLGVAHVAAGRREQRMALMLAQPLFQVEVIELLAPEHSRQRLTMHPALIFVQRVGRNPLVEFVRVGDPAFEYPIEIAKGIFYLGGRQTQPNRLAAAGGHVEGIVGRRLGPRLGGIHRLALPRDDVGVERIFHVWGRVGLVPQTLRIAFVFSEQQIRGAIAMEPVIA